MAQGSRAHSPDLSSTALTFPERARTSLNSHRQAAPERSRTFPNAPQHARTLQNSPRNGPERARTNPNVQVAPERSHNALRRSRAILALKNTSQNAAERPRAPWEVAEPREPQRTMLCPDRSHKGPQAPQSAPRRPRVACENATKSIKNLRVFKPFDFVPFLSHWGKIPQRLKST